MDTLGSAPLDKDALIGGCSRLPLKVDANRLRAEVDALPSEVWSTTGGRVGVHQDAGALFLRGYAPAEGDKPIEDREVLDRLPYCRELIEALGAPPARCLFARLPGNKIVSEHVDHGAYFTRHIRIHIPVATHERAYMMCAGLCYVMPAGEVWALNNSARHAVWNGDPDRARTHMICDFTLTPALSDLLGRADRSLGRPRPDVETEIKLQTSRRLALAAG